MKTAIIDVGSNTIRLSVYNTFEDGTFELLFFKKETAGLAGYIRHGRMSCGGNRQLILRYSPYASPSTGWQKNPQWPRLYAWPRKMEKTSPWL